MNWIPLRKNNIPIVDLQIQKSIETFHQLRSQILEGDILSVQKISELQSSIYKRIHEIDKFYNQNCLDQRVRFLQKGRMALAKLLAQNFKSKYELQQTISLPWKNKTQRQSSQLSPFNASKLLSSRSKKKQSHVKINKSNLQERQKSVTPVKKSILKEGKKENKKNQSIMQNRQKQKQKQIQKQKFKSMTKTPPKAPKTSRKMQKIPAKGETSKIEKRSYEEGNIKTQRTRKTTLNKNNEENESSAIKRLSQLIFTIKMTKEQYNEFVAMKSKMHNNL